MIYRKQRDFDNFTCIADICPKSCCIGWQIVIDEDSLQRYETEKGNFSARLKQGVDYEEGVFCQHQNGRCAMLNESGLCDLQTALGESGLCDTCKLYPRHTEEFQDLREYSLSLSCPEAARMLLDPAYDFDFTETEDDLEDDPAEFEDFDFLIFDQLEYAREKMYVTASDQSLPLQERMSRIATMAYKLQECFDEGDILAMGDVTCEELVSAPNTGIMLSHANCMESLQVLADMEVLEPSWTDTLKATRNYWQNQSDDSPAWQEAMHPTGASSFCYEKILKSLLFTYFCGAVYDGEIYAKAMLSIQSVRWLMMMQRATGMDLEKTLYLFSREVEHSDLNINSIISYYEKELP